MANDFSIHITAEDDASEVLKKVGIGISNIGQQQEKAQKQTRKSADELKKAPSEIKLTFDEIGKGLKNTHKAANGLMKGLSVFGIESSFLFGAGIVSSLAGVGYALVDMTVKWANLGWSIGRTATGLGMTTFNLQSLRGAAGLAGVSAEDLSGGLKTLGDTLQGAVMGRNPEPMIFMSKLGLNLHRTADGAVDVTRGLQDIADVIQKFEGQTQVQNMIARMFGIENLLPLLRKGAQGIKDYQNTVSSLGGTPSDNAIFRASKFAESLERLSIAWGGLKSRIGDVGISFFSRPINWLTEAMSGGKWTADNNDQSLSRDAVGKINFNASTLGDRQHNPGNLRNWGGMPTANGFASFPDDASGLAAMKRQLELYGGRGINTLGGIIGTYAPAGDNNDVGAYVGDVSKQTGFGANERLNLGDPAVMSRLMNAMIRHEQGRNPYESQVAQVTGAPQAVKVDVLVRAESGTQATARVSGQQASGRIEYNRLGMSVP